MIGRPEEGRGQRDSARQPRRVGGHHLISSVVIFSLCEASAQRENAVKRKKNAALPQINAGLWRWKVSNRLTVDIISHRAIHLIPPCSTKCGEVQGNCRQFAVLFQKHTLSSCVIFSPWVIFWITRQTRKGRKVFHYGLLFFFPSRNIFQNCKLKVKLMTAKQTIVGGVES